MITRLKFQNVTVELTEQEVKDLKEMLNVNDDVIELNGFKYYRGFEREKHNKLRRDAFCILCDCITPQKLGYNNKYLCDICGNYN